MINPEGGRDQSSSFVSSTLSTLSTPNPHSSTNDKEEVSKCLPLHSIDNIPAKPTSRRPLTLPRDRCVGVLHGREILSCSLKIDLTSMLDENVDRKTTSVTRTVAGCFLDDGDD